MLVLLFFTIKRRRRRKKSYQRKKRKEKSADRLSREIREANFFCNIDEQTCSDGGFNWYILSWRTLEDVFEKVKCQKQTQSRDR